MPKNNTETKQSATVSIESRIEAVNEQLGRADRVTRTLLDASLSLGALITAVSYLTEIVADQHRQIEMLSASTKILIDHDCLE